MPIRHKGRDYRRVTEVTGAGDCEATAYADRHFPLLRTRTAHVVTVPGTMTHERIYQFLCKRYNIPFVKHKIDPAARDLLRKLRRLHVRQKRKWPDRPTSWETIIMKAHQCYAIFEAFWLDQLPYGINPYRNLIEHRMYSSLLNTTGQGDLFATIQLTGRLETKCHVQREENAHLAKPKEYFVICEHGPKDQCNCQPYWVVVLLDWKTSSRRQKSHQHQLAAYHFIAEETGVWDRVRQDTFTVEGEKHQLYPAWHVWSVLLGKHRLKRTTTPYQRILYEPYLDDFLGFCDVHVNPRNVAVDTKGNIGLKGRCMFCSEVIRCPDRVLWRVDGEQIIPLPISFRDVRRLYLTLTKHQLLDNPAWAGLKMELEHVLAQIEEQKRTESETDLAIRQMLEEYGLEVDVEMIRPGLTLSPLDQPDDSQGSAPVGVD